MYNDHSEDSTATLPVSVIICAKNEAVNLATNLPVILQQDYPKYEVLVVNDFSTDNTADILSDFAKDHPKLRVITLTNESENIAGKKVALAKGIEGSVYDNLLLTDADCTPNSPNWISQMCNGLGNQSDIVVGYGPFSRKSGIIDKVMRFDVFYTAVQYLSSTLYGMPYMGVGRNIAYKKSVYNKTGGFHSHMDLQSGDDDLFINEVADQSNVTICIDPGALTFSDAPSDIFSWFRQKRRHFSTGFRYKVKHQFALGVWHFSTLLFYISFLCLLLVNYAIITVSLLALTRFISQFVILKKCALRLGEQDLLLFSPFYELFITVFNLSAALSGRIIKKHKWN